MKKYLWCFLIVTATWIIPRLSHPAVDIGKLEPVETVLLTVNEWGLTIETDTGAEGHGTSLEDAMADLKERADSNIYLDTTNKLLISGDPEAYWGEIYTSFRPSCYVYGLEGIADLERATKYLSVHENGVTLNRLRAGEKIWRILVVRDGRGMIVGK